MNSEEKLVHGLRLVVEAFAEIVKENSNSMNITSNNKKDACDETFTMKQAAEYLQIAHHRIYTLARKGEIKHLKAGSKYLFRKKALDEWMEQELNKSVLKEKDENQYGIIRKVKE